MRDAKIMQIYEGTNQIQRRIIAKELVNDCATSARGIRLDRRGGYNPPTPLGEECMALTRLSRRMFLNTTATGAALGFAPRALRAQPATFKLGVIHPVTGPLADPGQACRLGAQMAAAAHTAAGRIQSLGGMKLELLLGDTQTKPDLGRLEGERVGNQGARVLMGSFESGSTAAMVSVAQQKRVPFLVDIAAADPITANVAKAVKDGQQK